MKTITNTTIYKCDFCNKKYEKKHACFKHEKYCTKNPVNFTVCDGCVHFETRKETIDIETHPSYYSEREFKFFFCKKHNQRMHPLKCERTGIVDKYPEQFNESVLLKKECEDYQYFL